MMETGGASERHVARRASAFCHSAHAAVTQKTLAGRHRPRHGGWRLRPRFLFFAKGSVARFFFFASKVSGIMAPKMQTLFAVVAALVHSHLARGCCRITCAPEFALNALGECTLSVGPGLLESSCPTSASIVTQYDALGGITVTQDIGQRQGTTFDIVGSTVSPLPFLQPPPNFELAEVELFDADGADITGYAAIEFLVPPDNADEGATSALLTDGAFWPNANTPPFVDWFPHEYFGSKPLVRFTFATPVCIAQIKYYTTNYQSFGIDPGFVVAISSPSPLFTVPSSSNPNSFMPMSHPRASPLVYASDAMPADSIVIGALLFRNMLLRFDSVRRRVAIAQLAPSE